jgi:transposase
MRHRAAKETPMHTTTLGIDLGKRSFHVVGLDGAGRVMCRDKLTRAQLHELFATHPPCMIGMETCCGAQHFGCLAAGHGHDVRLIPA